MKPADESNPLKVPMSQVGAAQPRWIVKVRPAALVEPEPAEADQPEPQPHRSRPARTPAEPKPTETNPAELELAGISLQSEQDISIDVALTSSHESVLVSGSIQAHWQGPCARCLIPVDGVSNIKVQEQFSKSPVEGEHYLLAPKHVDLTLMVREAILLDLPIHAVPCPNPAPCPHLPSELLADLAEQSIAESELAASPGSVGNAGADQPKRDPRWAALDVLRTNPADPDPDSPDPDSTNPANPDPDNPDAANPAR